MKVEKPLSKKEVNEKMIGKTVCVVDGFTWTGTVIEVIDDEHVKVLRGKKILNVDIFNIKSTN